jgi:hypothetical protein
MPAKRGDDPTPPDDLRGSNWTSGDRLIGPTDLTQACKALATLSFWLVEDFAGFRIDIVPTFSSLFAG